MGITVNGTFGGLKGSMEFDRGNSAVSSFDMTNEVSIINNDNRQRDKDLRSEDYFDVAKYPRIHLKTNKISSNGGFSLSCRDYGVGGNSLTLADDLVVSIYVNSRK